MRGSLCSVRGRGSGSSEYAQHLGTWPKGGGVSTKQLFASGYIREAGAPSGGRSCPERDREKGKRSYRGPAWEVQLTTKGARFAKGSRTGSWVSARNKEGSGCIRP